MKLILFSLHCRKLDNSSAFSVIINDMGFVSKNAHNKKFKTEKDLEEHVFDGINGHIYFCNT